MAGSTWYYQFPSLARLEAEVGSAALMGLAEAANSSTPEEEGALALLGEERGLAVDLAPPSVVPPRTSAELWRLAVDSRRRGAVLLMKCNTAFRFVGFLELRESTANRLMERA
jgi:hypothetical protein